MPTKNRKGTLQSRPVLYVMLKKEQLLLFSSLDQKVQFGVLKVCRTFGRTILVTSGGLEKTLTKSHDYS